MNNQSAPYGENEAFSTIWKRPDLADVGFDTGGCGGAPAAQTKHAVCRRGGGAPRSRRSLRVLGGATARCAHDEAVLILVVAVNASQYETIGNRRKAHGGRERRSLRGRHLPSAAAEQLGTGPARDADSPSRGGQRSPRRSCSTPSPRRQPRQGRHHHRHGGTSPQLDQPDERAGEDLAHHRPRAAVADVETLLVLDATTGRTASQSKSFLEAGRSHAIVPDQADGTEGRHRVRGGEELGLP